MNKSIYIIRQINLINLLLAGVLALFIYMLFSLVNAAFEYSLPPAKSPSDDIIENGAKSEESALPSPDDYIIITEQNLFHPDRKMVASAKDGAPIVRPDFVLYGTMITDDASIAFIDDLKASYTTTGRGKRQRVLRLGETLSGYILSEIYSDMVVMERDHDRLEVKVTDQQHKRENVSETPAPAKAIQQKSRARPPLKSNNNPGTSSSSDE